jgi:hypothetical protein
MHLLGDLARIKKNRAGDLLLVCVRGDVPARFIRAGLDFDVVGGGPARYNMLGVRFTLKLTS